MERRVLESSESYGRYMCALGGGLVAFSLTLGVAGLVVGPCECAVLLAGSFVFGLMGAIYLYFPAYTYYLWNWGRSPEPAAVSEGEDVAYFPRNAPPVFGAAGFAACRVSSAPRKQEVSVSFASRDGKVMSGRIIVTFRPDVENVGAWLETEPHLREAVAEHTEMHARWWGLQDDASELASLKWMFGLRVPGLAIDTAHPLDIRDTGKRLPADPRRDVRSILQVAKTVEELEAVRAQLQRTVRPEDRAWFDVLCEEWKNKIKDDNLG